MEQLVILIIIGVISFVNWLLQRAAKARAMRGEQSAPQQKIELPFDDSKTEDFDEEPPQAPAEVRRFLEALGLPADDTSMIERKPVNPPALPKQSRPSPQKTQQRVAKKPLPQEFTAPTVVDEKAALLARKFRSAEHSPSDEQKAEKGDFQGLLSSSTNLKEAIILCEVLGPPKALQ